MLRYLYQPLFSIFILATCTLSDFAISAPVELSEQEKSFLKTKQSIKMCVATDFLPHEDIVDGKYVGMSSEYINIIANNLDIPFVLVPTISWDETIRFIRERRCDVIPLIRRTPQRLEYLNFTQPYYVEPLVIATKSDKPYVIDLSEIITKPLGIVKGYAQVELLSKQFPNIKIIKVDSPSDGIRRLYDGEIYAFLGALNVIGFHIQQSGYRNIKINGTMEKDLSLSMGSRNDMPLLNGILNKAVKSIREDEIERIKNSWITVKYEKHLDYTMIAFILTVALMILSFTLYHYRILRKHNRLLETLSETDKLTGLNNRLKLDRFLQFHLDIYERHHEVFSVILIDIDYFKKFNDRFGHLIGDKVLAHVASLLKENCRKLDMVGRWGGEEFLMICPKTNLQEAAVLSETLRSSIEASHLENIDGVTISIGVAQIKISDNVNTIISRADNALFKAKEGGRNRIEIID